MYIKVILLMDNTNKDYKLYADQKKKFTLQRQNLENDTLSQAATLFAS